MSNSDSVKGEGSFVRCGVGLGELKDVLLAAAVFAPCVCDEHRSTLTLCD